MATVFQQTMLNRPKALGFSLLELLVVVFIIGILATMFTLSVGLLGGDSQLEKEAERLQATILLARESALTNGREYGLHFYPDQYEFAIYQEDFIEYYDAEDEQQDQSQWIQIASGELLGRRQLPDGITLEIDIDGREITLKSKQVQRPVAAADPDTPPAEDNEDNELIPYRPQIWLFSTGDMSPFIVRFRREFENASIELEFKDDGSVERLEN